MTASVTPMSAFATRIFKAKYAHEITNGSKRKEEWCEVSERVVRNVVTPYLPQISARLQHFIEQRKAMPGGRYLYAAGRRYQQLNNCFGGETRIITRKGVFTLEELCGQDVEILNRFGNWESAKVVSFGVQKLLRVAFARGRETVRATPNHRWWQLDDSRITTPELKKIPLACMRKFPGLDEEGIRHGIMFGDGYISNGGRYSSIVFCTAQKEYLANCFTDEDREVVGGFGSKRKLRTVRRVKAGLGVYLQPPKYKTFPDLKDCTPEYARGFIAGLIATDGSTKTSSVTISCTGMKLARKIRDLAVLGGCVVTGILIQRGEPNSINGVLVVGTGLSCVIGIKPFSAPLIRPDQYQDVNSRNTRRHKMWLDVSVDDWEEEDETYCCVVPGTESFTLANGAVTSNCYLFRCQDSREGWSNLASKTMAALMTGGGIGVVYSDLREEGSLIRGMGGTSSGPIALMKIINEQGRYTHQGGSRRSAIWAGLRWNHPDIFKFIRAKTWGPLFVAGKKEDFNFPAPLDMTNISVILDTKFFTAYHDEKHQDHFLAHDVFWSVVRSILATGEPGFSVDIGENEGENNRNACCEVTSSDDDDMCNLLSLNMGKIDTIEEFAEACELGIGLLICGTLASKLPVDSMYKVREKNRRLGLGLMGVHEWLLKRGYQYGPCDELAKWMNVYRMSGAFANRYADKLSISRPIATRSIAPTGTISIIGETTSGIEPIFATAQKRRFLDGSNWKAQYIVDPTAKRLVDGGMDPDLIEDSLSLSEDVERRMKFQAWLQSHVDHGISSTINLPPWGSELNNESNVTKFGNILLKYLPELRGITAYPDGARDGQPLTRVPYREAEQQLGVEFIDMGECTSGVCGS